MSYQAIYIGRDGKTYTSRRYSTAGEAQRYLDEVVIGAGLVVMVDGGVIRPVQATDTEGGTATYETIFERA